MQSWQKFVRDVLGCCQVCHAAKGGPSCRGFCAVETLNETFQEALVGVHLGKVGFHGTLRARVSSNGGWTEFSWDSASPVFFDANKSEEVYDVSCCPPCSLPLGVMVSWICCRFLSDVVLSSWVVALAKILFRCCVSRTGGDSDRGLDSGEDFAEILGFVVGFCQWSLCRLE